MSIKLIKYKEDSMKELKDGIKIYKEEVDYIVYENTTNTYV